MMGHRVSSIRRPSSFLLIPVGSPAGICICGASVAIGRRRTRADRMRMKHHRAQAAVFPDHALAQRSDIGRNVAGFGPAQGKVRHLRVRVEQEEGEPLRTELRPARDGHKEARLRWPAPGRPPRRGSSRTSAWRGRRRDWRRRRMPTKRRGLTPRQAAGQFVSSPPSGSPHAFACGRIAHPQHDPGNCERSMRAMIDRSSRRAERYEVTHEGPASLSRARPRLSV